MEINLSNNHKYDIGGYHNNKLLCIYEEDCLIHTDGHIYKNYEHHLCGKWYHKKTNEILVNNKYEHEHILSLIQIWNDSFQHITFDTLPKLNMIQKLIEYDEKVKILVMSNTQKNLLRTFGKISEDKIIVRDNNHCSYAVKKGYYIAFINNEGHPTRMGSSGDNILFNYVYKNSNYNDNKYICYISRRGNKFRELNHKDELKLIQALNNIAEQKNKELKIFINPKKPDELKPILQNTCLFLSVHGGGMGNIIWLNQTSKIVEIIPKKGLCERPCFYYLAQALGIDYTAFEPILFNFNEKHISIDTDKLYKYITNLDL